MGRVIASEREVSELRFMFEMLPELSAQTLPIGSQRAFIGPHRMKPVNRASICKH
jgi:hypothetical protein